MAKQLYQDGKSDWWIRLENPGWLSAARELRYPVVEIHGFVVIRFRAGPFGDEGRCREALNLINARANQVESCEERGSAPPSMGQFWAKRQW